MIGRLKRGVIGGGATLILALAVASSAQAQEVGGRFRVLIPDLFPAEGTKKNFGEDTAKELRELMNSLATHQAIERKEINDDLKRFKMKMDELNCIRTRQLGAQMNAQVALCADFAQQGDQVRLTNIQFVDMGSSQVFEVGDITVGKDDEELAARQIFDAFDTYVQQVRRRVFCFDYASSSQWESALSNCDIALELNPGDEGVRYQKAFVLWKMEQMEESLAELETLLADNPYHEEALQLGGFLATSLGQNDEGREFYGRYLELNPGAVAVRRNIAYEMFNAGDPEGAMILIEEGLAVEESIDLLGDFGNYAFEAARRATPEGVQTGDAEIPADVRELYGRAIDAYMQVFDAKGDSMSVGQLRNVISAHIQLGNPQEASATAEQVLEVFPQEGSVWAVYSTALERQGRVDEAVAALKRIETIDPGFPDLYARQGNMLLAAGRRADALPILRRAVDEQGQDPNRVARIIFGDAYSKGVAPDQKNWGYALEGILAAKEYQVSAENRQEFNFWHGWVLYQQGMQAQEPQTVQSAQRSVPLFRQAKDLFESARGYAQQRGINLTQILDATNQYIEIQDAIIRRGR
ncbi:MAG: tetratricopeptide repeat protein [Longimicrobiales bacterium]|nr:tetratricopeptide repeat protein [Longimicrobiales bacterium]